MMEEREKKEKEELKKKRISQKLILDQQVNRDSSIKNKTNNEKEAWVHRKILKKMDATFLDFDLS